MLHYKSFFDELVHVTNGFNNSRLHYASMRIPWHLPRFPSSQLQGILSQRWQTIRTEQVANKGEGKTLLLFGFITLNQLAFVACSYWHIQKELPYPLLSDPQRTFIKALGAGTGNKTTRSHFVFEKGGKLVDRRVPVKPADRLVFGIFSPALKTDEPTHWRCDLMVLFVTAD